MTVNSSPEWVGLSDLLGVLEALAEKMGERCGDHCSNSCRMCEVRNDLRMTLIRFSSLERGLAQHIERVKREARLEQIEADAKLCMAAKVRPDGSCAGHTILDCHSSDAYWIRAQLERP